MSPWRHRARMQAYILPMLLLSGAAFIHSESAAPELRPSSHAADGAWKILGKASSYAWIALLVWGALRLPWWQPLAAFLGSLAVNALIAQRGPRAAWPGLSMVLAVVGLGLAGWAVLR
jgi:hypothetical protein